MRRHSHALFVGVIAIAVMLAIPQVAAAAVEDVPTNAKDFALSVVGSLLLVAVAGTAVFCFIKAQWSKLAVTLVAGMFVAWLAMSPNEAANQGRDFVSSLFKGGG